MNDPEDEKIKDLTEVMEKVSSVQKSPWNLKPMVKTLKIQKIQLFV